MPRVSCQWLYCCCCYDTLKKKLFRHSFCFFFANNIAVKRVYLKFFLLGWVLGLFICWRCSSMLEASGTQQPRMQRRCRRARFLNVTTVGDRLQNLADGPPPASASCRWARWSRSFWILSLSPTWEEKLCTKRVAVYAAFNWISNVKFIFFFLYAVEWWNSVRRPKKHFSSWW